MTTITKLADAERKIKWFIGNKSTATYALNELAEALKLVREVKETIANVLPQVNDVMDGKAKIVYL